MKKNIKKFNFGKKSLIIVLAITLPFSLYSSYVLFFYGNPKKIAAAEDEAYQLVLEKGYEPSDINLIKGYFNIKEQRSKAYGAIISLKDTPDNSYNVSINNGDIFEFDKLPEKN
ncbi:hypothetical protein [Alkalihalobacillus trypoxylicola]|uniref:DUF3139 domain-containing protein n=1 Tax=Alkalihalobacillus trypoxylicola TaxID=519424 RepID=A0A162DML5_9BACI|nr:hypothetical protein [Alkalihalobacillus trypoxylicola]KYG30039.1 hypothetical protein AZF04_20050 [Alkalihalobacillus trypoxylicola]